MAKANGETWLLEVEGGEEFVVEDLLGWCDTMGLHTFALYSTYDKTDWDKPYEKRYYKNYRLIGKNT